MLAPAPAEALKLLHRLAADPGIVGIMQKHRLVSALSPDGCCHPQTLWVPASGNVWNFGLLLQAFAAYSGHMLLLQESLVQCFSCLPGCCVLLPDPASAQQTGLNHAPQRHSKLLHPSKASAQAGWLTRPFSCPPADLASP